VKAISIRQPWAWLIIAGVKPIENRTWPTKVRGRVLVHAAKGMTRYEYESACHLAWSINPEMMIPAFEKLQRGGIIGSVEIVDCVQRSDSPWYEGEYGFVLRDPQPLPFISLKGALGFFEVDQTLINKVTA
jgi:hypothetical protein